MVPPIPLGTLLRQRYLIEQVLGQGGFGRTYLALDQERFGEACVLKELIVPYHNEALIEKSKALFQREATTLYQLQHPQIPRFWAAFEDEERLFLVQEWIDGQTYRHILQERRQRGQQFTEAEIIHLLRHLLGVLGYLHDLDIIHRDISPENIMARLRHRENSALVGLPVLIDFGAVKEAASHWPLVSSITRVGKVGYAPPEQLQTGKVYPHSDLYALAASCLVLLTGKEPLSLLDSHTLTWNWQPYVQTSAPMTAILQRMLALQPGDRYQSAAEVLADLQPLVESPSLPITQLPLPVDRVLTPPPVFPTSALLPVAQPTAVTQQEQGRLRFPSFASHSLRTRRLIGAGVGVGVGAVASLLLSFITNPPSWVPLSIGVLSWGNGKHSQAELRVSSRGNQHILGTPFLANPSQQASGQQGRPQSIQFAPGEIATVLQGNLQDYGFQPYMLEAAQGQIMTVTLEGPGVVMNLLRSNQQGIDAAAYQTRSWTGQLPADDNYLIQVSGSGPYSLEVAVTPLSRPTQSEIQRVTFARSSHGTTVTGLVNPNQIRRYLLKAKRGQIIAVKVLEGKVNLSTIAPTGERLGNSNSQSRDWQGRLPVDGDYVIEVTASQRSEFALSFEIF